MPKSNNPTVVPKIILYTGKALQAISTNLAVNFAKKIFMTPIRHKMPKRELEMDANSIQKKIFVPSLDQEIMVYQYGTAAKTVLLIHGWSGRGTQLVKIADALLANGFSTISFDAPAHGKSTGSQTLMTAFIASVLEIKKQYPNIQYAVGHSLGAMTLLNSIKQGLDIKKGVLIGSGNSIIEIVSEFIKVLELKPAIATGIREKFDKETGEDMESYSAYVAAAAVTCPILLFHDKNDVEVGYHCSEQIDAVLENSQLILTEKLGHKKILGNDKVISQLIDFIKEA